MQKLKDILFSMTTSVILLIIFGTAIAYATFAENSSGTEYARQMVYNAKWFEVLLVLLIINLTGSMMRFKLFSKRKFSILLFHLAFILIVIGAGITRYFGSEGMMHIREGESSNEISSNKTSVRIIAEQNGRKVEKTTEAQFSSNGSNNFSETIEIGNKKLKIESELFMPNAVETIVPDENGEAALSVFVMNQQNQGTDFILLNGERNRVEETSFSFNDSTQKADISFTLANGELYFKSSSAVARISMMDNSEELIKAGTNTLAGEKTIYKTDKILFVLKSFLPKARKNLTQYNAETNNTGITKAGKDGIVFRVSDGNATKKVNVLSAEGQVSVPSACELNDVKISISYGMLPHKLPFNITLRKFELERYPGSNSPSSYASEITLTDPENNIQRPFRIYMNNILKYRGYRFFQSSYDADEKGTVLSVSNDYWGTMVSYIGYFLMMAGMVLTLFNKNSRFRTVLRLSSELQKKRRGVAGLILIGLLSVSVSCFAGETATNKQSHIDELSSLLIQDEAQGRIEPFSTFASDVFRKISKQNSYNGVSPVEVMLGFISDPSTWQNEPIIKVGNPELAKELGAVNGYVSFNQLFDFENGGVYRLSDKVNKVYQNEQTARNKYDKELINVDERANICYQLFNGSMLALFPNPDDNRGKWSIAQSTGENQGQGEACPHSMGGMTSHKSATASMFIDYIGAVKQATASGNWEIASQKLNVIKNYQQSNGGKHLPGKNNIKLEILYNDLNLFPKLAIIYVILGMILLILHLIDIFRTKSGLEKILNKGVYLFLVVFGIYTLGLFLRWYISGHAPWSNGYETMIFVGWAAALSGLAFSRRSSITLAVTGILSAIALFVAGMSWMNPEITNLVPVLKSYWLIIHVAVITSSYGFLAMGAILGLLNLTLIIARTRNNSDKLNNSIQEISYIIELTLSIGLLLLTIGCFIGAVWANESWGRYWGWDPKETWALVSILVYAAILHLRKIQTLNNQFVISSLALIGFSSIIMTFFGVNYYLSGMHSYGQGTPPSIPIGVYIALAAIIILIIAAYNSHKKMSK